MAERYEFAVERLPDDEVRLTWARNGDWNPLNFWIVLATEIADAKHRVRSGEFDAIYR